MRTVTIFALFYHPYATIHTCYGLYQYNTKFLLRKWNRIIISVKSKSNQIILHSIVIWIVVESVHKPKRKAVVYSYESRKSIRKHVTKEREFPGLIILQWIVHCFVSWLTAGWRASQHSPSVNLVAQISVLRYDLRFVLNKTSLREGCVTRGLQQPVPVNRGHQLVLNKSDSYLTTSSREISALKN